MIANWAPDADRDAARAVATALDRIGYTEDRVEELLDGNPFPGELQDVPIHDRRLPRTPLGTATRVCFLGLPVPADEAEAAFGVDGVGALGTVGLASRGAELVPRGRITHVHGLLLASDGYSLGESDVPGYVAAYTPTAHQCAALTPRRRVARALDVGTGNGIQALLMARHARRVVATDVNPRALAFASLNAALNGFENVELRQGSLFEPVEREPFDLIACNAPFVVSPEARFAYRDGGFTADGLSARLVADAAAHLADGGHATLLVSWVAASADEADDRVLGWTDGIGCDAWILDLGGADPLAHAAGWNDYVADDPERYGAVVDDWTTYLDELRVGWVTEGAVLLRRRAGRPNTVRIDAVEDEELEPAGRQVDRVFANRERLAGLGRRGLLAERPLAAASVVLECEQRLRGARRQTLRLRLDEGTHFVREITPRDADLLAALDGTVTLGEAIGGDRPARAVRFVRELLELGFLEL